MSLPDETTIELGVGHIRLIVTPERPGEYTVTFAPVSLTLGPYARVTDVRREARMALRAVLEAAVMELAEQQAREDDH